MTISVRIPILDFPLFSPPCFPTLHRTRLAELVREKERSHNTFIHGSTLKLFSYVIAISVGSLFVGHRAAAAAATAACLLTTGNEPDTKEVHLIQYFFLYAK